jgi:hypothetical protein
LWDRGKLHRQERVQDYLEHHPQWHVEWLPPYDPEIELSRAGWTYLKFGCLFNFGSDGVEQTAVKYATTPSGLPAVRNS